MKEENLKKSRNAKPSSKITEATALSLIGKDLPHSKDAEEGLLASMMLDASTDVITTCITAKIREEYFYIAAHRKIFSTIIELFTAKIPIDEIVLLEKLKSKGQLEEIGGITELNRIAGRIETYAHYQHWLQIVKEKYFLRLLITTCHDTIDSVGDNTDDLDEFLENVESKFMAISKDRVSDTARHAAGVVDEAVQDVQKLIQMKGSYDGVPTGFTLLDDMLRGLHGNEMIVIAGRPGTGKTSIALNIAEAAIFNKQKPVPTLIFSLEMTSKSLMMRMLCSRASIDQQKLRKGVIESREQLAISTTGVELKKAPLYIDEVSDMNILELRAKARRMHKQHDIGLIVIDYLQLLKGTGGKPSREQEVAEISRGIKGMAKELNVPVIVLAQLNRSMETGDVVRDPRASDLRESGSIEQDADVILLLSWQNASKSDPEIAADTANKLVKLVIAKQRNGPTGDITLLFNRNLTKYQNYSKHDDKF